MDTTITILQAVGTLGGLLYVARIALAVGCSLHDRYLVARSARRGVVRKWPA